MQAGNGKSYRVFRYLTEGNLEPFLFFSPLLSFPLKIKIKSTEFEAEEKATVRYIKSLSSKHAHIRSISESVMDNKFFTFLRVLLCLTICGENSDGTRVRGVFETKNFFHFLTKFGFQKTDFRTSERGFIFGNVTASEENALATLAVLDRGYFLEYYGNKSLVNKSKACSAMFDKIRRVAYDAHCFDDGAQDFLRTVPCPKGGLCAEEDRPENVVKGYQFTYRIQDFMQSRFWYVSLVACTRNKTTCEWEPIPEDKNISISYDLWLVNGSPMNSNKNLLRYQYSCDIQGLLGVYILALVFYAVLSALQFYASYRQNHNITKLLASGVFIELLALLGISIHQSLFSLNGVGLPIFEVLGELLEILSQSLFMLLLLLLAMGWAITNQDLKCKFALSTLWILYTFVHCLLYAWKKYEVDVIEDVVEYQTVPGIIILILRVVVMLCFLVALRETMLREFTDEILHFLLHFGAASLVWFIYLPIIAIVALQISALWRNKFLMGISYSVDTFAYIILIHSLWPSRTQQYFLLASQIDHTDELEELSESPNQINQNSLIIMKNKKITDGSTKEEFKTQDLLVLIDT